jgi:hypothetical protein
MSAKNTWLWIIAAVAVFGFIFVFERYFREPEPGPWYMLPGFNARAVRTVQIRAGGQPEILVLRTNSSWQLVEPISYPAHATNVQTLLNALQQVTVAHYISEQEMRKDPKADVDYGIDPPQLSLVIDSGAPIYFGRKTTPGDQVFVRVIGNPGIYIVDASLLNLFPQNTNSWRETVLADLSRVRFDRVTVTNTSKSVWFQLQQDPTNRLWSMTLPMKARADGGKVENALGDLDNLHVQQFVSDDPKADLESFGLQPPALTVALAQGTNGSLSLDFGKELTNSPGFTYARREDQSSVVVVPTNALGAWGTSYETFRDRHLVTLLGPMETIQIQGQDTFSMQWQTNNSWRVQPDNFVADPQFAMGVVRELADLQVAAFEKDSVTEPDLPHYGLATPARKIVISWATSPTATNAPTELHFGTNSDAKVFAQRVGEDAVYGIAPADFEKLPSASWEMHDRRVWDFDIDDVSGVRVQNGGREQRLVRNGTNGWSFAAGSQGAINDAAVENTTRELGQLTAVSWVGHGAAKVPAFGFATNDCQLSIELKSGKKLNLQFGGTSSLGAPYAMVVLDGEPWIFEFSPYVFAHLQYSRMIPMPP